MKPDLSMLFTIGFIFLVTACGGGTTAESETSKESPAKGKYTDDEAVASVLAGLTLVEAVFQTTEMLEAEIAYFYLEPSKPVMRTCSNFGSVYLTDGGFQEKNGVFNLKFDNCLLVFEASEYSEPEKLVTNGIVSITASNIEKGDILHLLTSYDLSLKSESLTFKDAKDSDLSTTVKFDYAVAYSRNDIISKNYYINSFWTPLLTKRNDGISNVKISHSQNYDTNNGRDTNYQAEISGDFISGLDQSKWKLKSILSIKESYSRTGYGILTSGNESININFSGDFVSALYNYKHLGEATYGELFDETLSRINSMEKLVDSKIKNTRSRVVLHNFTSKNILSNKTIEVKFNNFIEKSSSYIFNYGIFSELGDQLNIKLDGFIESNKYRFNIPENIDNDLLMLKISLMTPYAGGVYWQHVQLGVDLLGRGNVHAFYPWLYLPEKKLLFRSEDWKRFLYDTQGNLVSELEADGYVESACIDKKKRRLLLARFGSDKTNIFEVDIDSMEQVNSYIIPEVVYFSKRNGSHDCREDTYFSKYDYSSGHRKVIKFNAATKSISTYLAPPDGHEYKERIRHPQNKNKLIAVKYKNNELTIQEELLPSSNGGQVSILNEVKVDASIDINSKIFIYIDTALSRLYVGNTVLDLEDYSQVLHRFDEEIIHVSAEHNVVVTSKGVYDIQSFNKVMDLLSVGITRKNGAIGTTLASNQLFIQLFEGSFSLDLSRFSGE